MKKGKNIVAGIYFHPEAYPPTLNAINELSDSFEMISVVHRNHAISKWQYPKNVELVASGSLVSSVEQQQASLPKKILFFLNFTATFFKVCRRQQPELIVVYDSLSLYAYHLTRSFLKFTHKVWYHNHDVTEPDNLRKFSIGWMADRAEKKAFHYLDIFSLPSNERRKYFPLENFRGKYFFIPNYPSKRFYAQYFIPHEPEATIKLIFQGQVAPFRGLEEIIPLLAQQIQNRRLRLSIVGPCSEEYRRTLENLISKHEVACQVQFTALPYSELPAFSAQHDIGLGILADGSIMHATIATASNKLYEYAALGLPVLYYDNPHQREVLSKYTWTFGVAFNPGSILEAIQAITQQYSALSVKAHQDFLTNLNFETIFLPAKQYVSISS